MGKPQATVSPIENVALSEDTSSSRGIDDTEYREKFFGSYTIKNCVHVYIDRSSYECMKRFLSIAAPDTSMAGYVSRIIDDRITRNASTIIKIFEDSKTKLF